MSGVSGPYPVTALRWHIELSPRCPLHSFLIECRKPDLHRKNPQRHRKVEINQETYTVHQKPDMALKIRSFRTIPGRDGNSTGCGVPYFHVTELGAIRRIGKRHAPAAAYEFRHPVTPDSASQDPDDDTLISENCPRTNSLDLSITHDHIPNSGRRSVHQTAPLSNVPLAQHLPMPSSILLQSSHLELSL